MVSEGGTLADPAMPRLALEHFIGSKEHQTFWPVPRRTKRWSILTIVFLGDCVLFMTSLKHQNSRFLSQEDKGVDLYVLEKALLSTHPDSEEIFQVHNHHLHSSSSKGKLKFNLN